MRAAWWTIALGAALVAWCFAGIGCGQMFAVRDAAHYYYPLLQYVRSQWRAGQVPLWNPYQDLGMPLAAGGTAAAFYPPALVLVLAPTFEAGYRVYVVGHVVLAMLSAWLLARQWQASGPAAAAAAAAYAFSGSVLFQHANVVYLVGAAWFPLALRAGERLLEGHGRAAMGLAATTALMVLGGDLQAAYHAAVWIAARWLWFGGAASKGAAGRGPAGAPAGGPMPANNAPSPFHKAGNLACAGNRLVRWATQARLTPLAAALSLGGVLAAVQILPSAEFARLSHRTQALVGTLWELPAVWREGQMGAWAQAFLGRGIRPGSHREQIYHYSVGPWRAAELVWPNCGGRCFPEHRRWFAVLPAEGPLWVPSLYLGVLPLVLAVRTMRFFPQKPGYASAGPGAASGAAAELLPSPREEARVRWLSWMTMLFAAGSLGWHGLGWVGNELRMALGAHRGEAWPIGPPFGGVYWAMTVLLAGYSAFRYPGKLFTVATLGLAMLAAAGWDRAVGPDRPQVRKCLARLAVLSAWGALAAILLKPAWTRALAGVPASPQFGPFDAQGAFCDLVGGLVHTGAVAAVALGLLAAASSTRWARRLPAFLTILVALDVGVANRWMVGTAPQGLWRANSVLAESIQRDALRRGQTGPVRVFRRPAWTAQSWKNTLSASRLAEIVQWNRNTLQPLHHLGVPLALAQVADAMNLADYRMWLAAARQTPDRQRPALLPGQEVLDAVGAAYVVLAGNEVPEVGVRVKLAKQFPCDADVSLWYNAEAYPRAWIVHRVVRLEPLGSTTPQAMLRRTREVLAHLKHPAVLRDVAVVEAQPANSALPAWGAGGIEPHTQPSLARQSAAAAEKCRIVRYEPCRVEIEVQLQQEGLVVLADQFYPGWTLEVASNGSPPRRWPVLRTNRVMRGAWLPPGRHRLVYRYRPASFPIGALLSGVGWAAVGAWLGWDAARRTVKTPAACRLQRLAKPLGGLRPKPAAPTTPQ